ncbi:protein kinase [bacterium]|nr:protein kinase [bacterium]
MRLSPDRISSLAIAVESGFEPELDSYIESFERAAVRGFADPSDFLPPQEHPRRQDVLVELLRVDMELSWERGERRGLDHYRTRYPELFVDQTAVHALVVEESRLRQASGTPQLASSAIESHDFPPAGTTIPPGFVLESELGSGAFGRVFLARQSDLAHRRVAVKLSSRFIGEAQTLARLQHTNIVPIYSLHQVGPFQAIVMPFLGRNTFENLITAVRKVHGSPITGQIVSDLLPVDSKSSGAHAPSRSALKGSARFARMPYASTVMTLGAEIAEGLAHAHETGVLHRDLKPANVLISDDGTPMLLDFNLASDSAHAEIAGIGGTFRYMAPECISQIENRKDAASVQSDIYALGLLLFETMTGRLPWPDRDISKNLPIAETIADRTRVFDRNWWPDAPSPAFASIVAKCLAPEPAKRYESARHLQEDLRRQLEDRTLRFAPDPSPRERLGKWIRRHPKLVSGSSIGSIAALLLLVVLAGWYSTKRHATKLEALRLRDSLHEVASSVYHADPNSEESTDLLNRIDDITSRYGIKEKSWEQGPMMRLVSSEDRQAIMKDLAETLTIAAGLAPDGESRRRSEEARYVTAGFGGDSVANAISGKRLPEKAESLIESTRNGTSRIATWMTLGSVQARLGRHREAVEAYSAAIGLDPAAPWPWFHRGVARIEIGEHKQSIADFDRFLALRPGSAEGYFDRGIARQASGDPSGAIADFDESERLGFRHVRLYAVRGQTKRRQGDKPGADADLARVFDANPTDARGLAIRGEERLRNRPDSAVEALADFDRALAKDVEFLPAWRDKASVLSENLGRPAEALAALDRVLEMTPDSIADRAGRAVLHARLGHKTEAHADAAACTRSTNGLILYQAACAYLIGEPGPVEITQGLKLLRLALRQDPSWARTMRKDNDLKAVHGDNRFLELIQAAISLSRTD